MRLACSVAGGDLWLCGYRKVCCCQFVIVCVGWEVAERTTQHLASKQKHAVAPSLSRPHRPDDGIASVLCVPRVCPALPLLFCTSVRRPRGGTGFVINVVVLPCSSLPPSTFPELQEPHLVARSTSTPCLPVSILMLRRLLLAPSPSSSSSLLLRTTTTTTSPSNRGFAAAAAGAVAAQRANHNTKHNGEESSLLHAAVRPPLLRRLTSYIALV